MIVFVQKLLYSGKVVLLGQKWLQSIKSGCILAKVTVIEQGSCIRAKVVIIRAKVVVFGEN